MRTLILILLSFSSFAAVDTGAKKYSIGPTRTKDTAWNRANTRLDGAIRFSSYTASDSLYYLGVDSNGNIHLYPLSAVVSGVVSVNGESGVVILNTDDILEGANKYYKPDTSNSIQQRFVAKQDALGFTPVTNARTLTINGTTYDLTANRTWSISVPFYADSLLRAFDSLAAHNIRLINLGYGVDTAKQNIRNEIDALPIPYFGDSIAILYDSITAHNIRLITLRYMMDTSSTNIHTWAYATFLQIGASAGGDFTGTYPNPALATSGVSAGTYGSAIAIPIVTVDSKGRTTGVTTVTPTPSIGNVTGLGTGVSTFLQTPSSDNLGSAVTGEIGAGQLVFKPADTTISAAYTLTTRDLFRTIHCTNGSNIALTIPTGLGTNFVCNVLAEGAGTVTPTASSTTLNYRPTSTTKISANGGATIQSYATANTFLIIGSLE